MTVKVIQASFKPFKIRFLYSFAAADKIPTHVAHGMVHLLNFGSPLPLLSPLLSLERLERGISNVVLILLMVSASLRVMDCL